MLWDYRFETQMRALELKVPPGVLVLVIGVWMWFGSSMVPTLDFRIPSRWIIACAFVLFGFGISGLGVVEFRRVRTTLNPLTPGSSSTLVTQGIYRFTRNPMYLGMLMVLIGVAVATANLSAFLLLPVFVLYMNEFQIKPEERALAGIFGKKFEDYRSEVRRWI